MKKLMIWAVAALFCGTTGARAVSSDSLKYVNASDYLILGKAFDQTEALYERLPAYLKDSLRKDLWALGRNSSGIAIRFRTDAKNIAARWTLLNNFRMNHMTDVGIRGLDLYRYEDGKWRFVNSGRPTLGQKENQKMIISNMQGDMYEYMLYLPLYDGITALEIGVDSSAVVEQPQLSTPRRGKPVLIYGTSVTQGGCASRPGMVYTALLSRALDKEVLNLGFSGNGRLDLEIARALADYTDPSVFVLDCMPNCTYKEVAERGVKFIEILRAKHPDTPILVVDNFRYPHSEIDLTVKGNLDKKEAEVEKVVAHFREKGDRNIHYLKYDGYISPESTVDGVHLTDRGFTEMADRYYRELKKIIRD